VDCLQTTKKTKNSQKILVSLATKFCLQFTSEAPPTFPLTGDIRRQNDQPSFVVREASSQRWQFLVPAKTIASAFSRITAALHEEQRLQSNIKNPRGFFAERCWAKTS